MPSKYSWVQCVPICLAQAEPWLFPSAAALFPAPGGRCPCSSSLPLASLSLLWKPCHSSPSLLLQTLCPCGGLTSIPPPCCTLTASSFLPLSPSQHVFHSHFLLLVLPVLDPPVQQVLSLGPSKPHHPPLPSLGASSHSLPFPVFTLIYLANHNSREIICLPCTCTRPLARQTHNPTASLPAVPDQHFGGLFIRQ